LFDAVSCVTVTKTPAGAIAAWGTGDSDRSSNSLAILVHQRRQDSSKHQQHRKNNGVSQEGGAESGAESAKTPPIDPDLAEVIKAWPALPIAVRAGILAMVRGVPK
jgi:hypothetical protein